MIQTTEQELGIAYRNASSWLFRKYEPLTPRMLGALFREQFGLHHRHARPLFGEPKFWIEFPNDRDYTLFLLRWSSHEGS